MAGKPHQKPSVSMENQDLRQNILSAASMVRESIRQFIQPFGITPNQLEILQILQLHDSEKSGLTILEIRDAMNDHKPDTSRLVARLTDKKMVERKKGSTDKRFTRVSLTKMGASLLADVKKRYPELNLICQHLSRKELNELNRLLKKFQGQLDGGATG